MGTLINNTWEYLMELLQTSLSEHLMGMFTFVMNFINGTSSDFWEEPVISALLAVSQKTTFIVLVLSIPFLLNDLAQQAENIDYSTVAYAFARTYIFAKVGTLVGLMSFKSALWLVDSMGANINVSDINQGLGDIVGNSGAMFIPILLMLLIGSLMFLFKSVGCCGSMLIHILALSIYIPFILKGDKQKLQEWITTTVSISVTYLFQFVMFYFSMYAFVGGNLGTSLTLMAASFTAQKILASFGQSSGGGNFMGKIQGAGMAVRGIKNISTVFTGGI